MKLKFKGGETVYAIEESHIREGTIRGVSIPRANEVVYTVRFCNSHVLMPLPSDEVFATPKELIDSLIYDFEDYCKTPVRISWYKKILSIIRRFFKRKDKNIRVDI